ncbi:MAG: CDP-alcohol phosphatidyltransferase family protein [Nitrospinaceae bacterium]
MHKLPPQNRFVDLSDYARPLASHFVRWLIPYRSITAITLTLAFTVVGLAAAFLIWRGQWLTVAALLLPAKSFLDAADGSLARARNTPSHVGRFLDSFCDFLVNLALFLAIAHYTGQPAWYALLALLLATTQGSVYNYYYVVKRHAAAGDRTSLVDERQPPLPHPQDHPGLLTLLHRLYLIIYYWQDRLVHRLDPRAVEYGDRLTHGFLSAVSVLGLGFQLLVICVFLLSGLAHLVFFYFTIFGTVYTLGLVFYRRRALS